jgi:hypothetical protein
MTGMVTWQDSLAIIATSNAYGGTAKIYYYNPFTNTMVDSINLGFTNYAFNANYNNGFYIVGDTLIGSKTYYEYYKINLKTKQLFQDASFLYYVSGKLDGGYIWMNTPTGGACNYNNNNSTCGMPSPYMLRLYNRYNAFAINYNVYSAIDNWYGVVRINNVYPLSSFNAKKKTTTLSAYPNPVSTYLYFNQSGTYTLFDMYGKQVSSTNSNSMYVGKLSAGLYILRNGNNSMKIIKQ